MRWGLQGLYLDIAPRRRLRAVVSSNKIALLELEDGLHQCDHQRRPLARPVSRVSSTTTLWFVTVKIDAGMRRWIERAMMSGSPWSLRAAKLSPASALCVAGPFPWLAGARNYRANTWATGRTPLSFALEYPSCTFTAALDVDIFLCAMS